MNDRKLVLLLVAFATSALFAGGAVIGIASSPEAAAILAKGAARVTSAGAQGIARLASAGAAIADDASRGACPATGMLACVKDASVTVVAGAGASCTTAPTTAAKPALVAKGVLTGNFDPAMSGVCQGACAVKIDVPASKVAAQPGAKTNAYTQCPVSGVLFKVKKENPAYAYAEKADVYTCCGSCLSRLVAEPEKFLKKTKV